MLVLKLVENLLQFKKISTLVFVELNKNMFGLDHIVPFYHCVQNKSIIIIIFFIYYFYDRTVDCYR